MISNIAYQEVFEILSYMDKKIVMKIPQDILYTINDRRDTNYKTRINKYDIFNEQNITKEAMDLLCYLDYHYWMSSENKKKINEISIKEYIKNEELKRKRYDPTFFFKIKNKF